MPHTSPTSIAGFRRLMLSRFLSFASKQIRMLAIMWQVWELTEKPLLLGCVGLAEGIPYIAASLYAGHIVDRHEKKRLLLVSLAGLVVLTLGLAYASNLDQPSVGLLFLLIGLSAVCSSFEMPTSSAYLQMIIPKETFSKAAAWNLSTYVGATILGPILSGFLLDRYNAATVYMISAVGFVVALIVAAPLKPIPAHPADKVQSPLEAVKEGLKFVVSKRIIMASMILDSFSVLFGEVVFVLPVFADMLGAGPIGLGFLRAAPAIGSLVVSAMESQKQIIRIRWDWLLRTVLIFGFSMILFGLSRSIVLSIVLLMVSGAADGVSVIIRQSLFQAHTPDAFRGRVSSVSGIFISASNELGGFESGLAAQLLGIVPSVIFGGTITIATVIAMWFKFPRLDELEEHEK